MKANNLFPSPGVSAFTGEEEAALDAWWAKYGAVEQAIRSAQERRRRRARATRRSRAREFGDICEMTGGLAIRWRRDGFFDGEETLLSIVRDAGYYAFLDYVRRESGRSVSKLKAAVRRPSYYAEENARRRALAAERRKIRERRTDNPCPTKEQILDAWIVRRKSHEDAIRFGSLIEDLECYVDNSLCRDEDGAIVGRRPGVKGWLKENLPALALQYTTVMRYKAAAKKLKEITGLADPTPVAVVLPPTAVEAETKKRDYSADEILCKDRGESGEMSEVGSCAADGGETAANDAGAWDVRESDRRATDTGATDDWEPDTGATDVWEPDAGATDVWEPDAGATDVWEPDAEGGKHGEDNVLGESIVGENGAEKNGTGVDDNGENKARVRFSSDNVGRTAEGEGDEAAGLALEIVRARAIWKEVVESARKSATALFERIDALTDPQRVEAANMLKAWREKYNNEITERTKKRWWRKLWRQEADKVWRG